MFGMIIKLIGIIIVACGVILVFDARVIVKRMFGFRRSKRSNKWIKNTRIYTCYNRGINNIF